MKKAITIFCLSASLLIILDSIGFWHMLVMFFFLGIIPGTNIVIAPIPMMLLMSTLAGYVVVKAFDLPSAKIRNLIKIKQSSLEPLKLRRLGHI